MAQSFCTMYLYMYIYYSIIYYLYTYIDNTFIDVYLYLFIIMYKYIYICVCVCMYTATQRERMESMLCQCFVACVIVFTHWLSAAMRWSELDQTNRRTLRSALSRSSVVCRHVCRVFTRWTGEKSTGNCLKHATSKKHAVNNLIRLGVSLIVFKP